MLLVKVKALSDTWTIFVRENKSDQQCLSSNGGVSTVDSAEQWCGTRDKAINYCLDISCTMCIVAGEAIIELCFIKSVFVSLMFQKCWKEKSLPNIVDIVYK